MTVPAASLIRRFPYAPAIISAFLLVLATPPFNLWWLVFIAFIPVYYFIISEPKRVQIIIGALIFSAIYIGYLSYVTIIGFDWIPEAYLFSLAVHLSPIPIFIALSATTAAIWLALTALGKRTRNALERALLFSTFAIPEFFITLALGGLNYGAVFYPALNVPAFLTAVSIGGSFLATVLVTFGNAAIAELIAWGTQRPRKHVARLFPAAIFAGTIVLLSIIPYPTRTAPTDTANVRIAIIQDQERDESRALGTTTGERFSFPALEKKIEAASTPTPAFIIYPFSPWVGAIAEEIDNTHFDREVVTVDFASFGEWTAEHTPTGATFITWGTAVRDGNFLNEFEFWKNGVLLDTYAKERLYPFFDYTPEWAQRIGIYSTPYDVTAGTSTAPVNIDHIAFGGLVCSEVSDKNAAEGRARSSDVLLAIGSEAMFGTPFASQFNLRNTQLRAAETGTPAIRANKFGPSALINADGTIAALIPYGEDGVLNARLSLERADHQTAYEQFGPYPAMVLLFGYLAVLLRRNKTPNAL